MLLVGSWKVHDHPLDIDKANPQTAFILHDLQPYTKYAVYVQTYTILSAKTGARSPILYFTTKPKSTYFVVYNVLWPDDLLIKNLRSGLFGAGTW